MPNLHSGNIPNPNPNSNPNSNPNPNQTQTQTLTRRAALHEHCMRLFIVSKAIMFPVSTRWWAELFSIARAFDLGNALLAVTATQMNLTGAKAAIYRAILAQFQGVLALLPPIIFIGRVWEKWQTILSSGTTVTLSYWPQAVRAILESVSINKEADARNSSDIVADIIADMRKSVIKRLAEIPLIALAAELLDPATTHHADNWPSGKHEEVANFLYEWNSAVAPPPAASVGGKWGGSLPLEMLEKTRKHAFMEELARVGKQLDDFSLILRSSPSRMKVILPPPCCAYSDALLTYFCRSRVMNGRRFGNRSCPQVR
jgi:hypothetical protein